MTGIFLQGKCCIEHAQVDSGDMHHHYTAIPAELE